MNKITGALVILLGLVMEVQAQPASGRPDAATFEYRDLTAELANKTKGRFVVAAVGDVLVMEPIGPMTDPKFAKLLKEADTTVGNLESTIVDRRSWVTGFSNNSAASETAADLAALGFDLMNNATGHAFDAGIEGLKTAVTLMKQAGVQIAGVGPNLSTARTAVFHATAKGRIGMIGAVSGSNAGIASDLVGNIRESITGGWGMNPLRLNTWNVVPPEQFQQLKAMRDSILARRSEVDPAHSNPIPLPRDYSDRVSVFGANFMVGPKPGEYHYEMDRDDESGNILAMRNTKEYADFAIFTMHVHQRRQAFVGMLQDNYPPDFLIDFARKLIDNGADMYVGHGNHALQGVEIYKGRPIFYGLGSFAQQQMMTEGSQEGSADIPAGMTPMEADELDLERLRRPTSMIGILATSTYQDGRLAEVRLYPIDLGTDKSRPWSQMGIAHTPSPLLAQEILAKVQLYSKPFGTRIDIENGVGVIKVSPTATTPVGGELRSTFPPGYRKQ